MTRLNTRKPPSTADTDISIIARRMSCSRTLPCTWNGLRPLHIPIHIHTYTIIPSCSHFLLLLTVHCLAKHKCQKKSNAMKSFYFNCNIRVAALINVVCLDWKAQIKVSGFFSSLSFQQMKKQHAPRSLCNMTERLPRYISSVKKSLCSPWVGLSMCTQVSHSDR